jgi:hypothetical protein
MNKWFELVSERAEVEELVLDFSYPDIVDLMPVVVICVISVMSIVIWLLVVWKYTQNKIQPENTNKL